MDTVWLYTSWLSELKPANTPGTESGDPLTLANPWDPVVKEGKIQIVIGFPLLGILLASSKPAELPSGTTVAVTILSPNNSNPSSALHHPNKILKGVYG
jgi:hypothetical protein